MPVKPVKKKEKLSKEESLYRSAVSLMEAVDCISRFDRLVSSLNDAAKKFSRLDSYKDSAVLMQKCLKDAQAAADSGAAEVFDTALKKLAEAKSKSDFADIAEDFKLVKKFGYKKEECSKNIQYCQKRIRTLETIAALKRYIIILCILAILITVFINTPLFPFVKKLVFKIYYL